MKIGNLFCGCFVPRTACIDKSSSKLYVVPSDIYRFARTLEELDLNNNQVQLWRGLFGVCIEQGCRNGGGDGGGRPRTFEQVRPPHFGRRQPKLTPK